MSMTGLRTFDTTIQKTNEWVKDVAKVLGWEDKEMTFQGLRITLKTLRDRLTVDEAAHLGAQLPALLAGFYYEGWKPATNPSNIQSQAEFLAPIRDYLQNSTEADFSPERLVRGVFSVLSGRVSSGEISDVVHMMPDEIKEFWPQPIRT